MADESAMDHVYNTMMFQVPKPPVNQSSNTRLKGSSSTNSNLNQNQYPPVIGPYADKTSANNSLPISSNPNANVALNIAINKATSNAFEENESAEAAGDDVDAKGDSDLLRKNIKKRRASSSLCKCCASYCCGSSGSG